MKALALFFFASILSAQTTSTVGTYCTKMVMPHSQWVSYNHADPLTPCGLVYSDSPNNPAQAKQWTVRIGSVEKTFGSDRAAALTYIEAQPFGN